MRLHIRISLAEQKLFVLNEKEAVIASFFVSSSKFGEGVEEGSNKTPLGDFLIAEKIGGLASRGTVFKGRAPVGNWLSDSGAFDADSDLILTRILWLSGAEEVNENTHDRYIYLHGTNQESLLGCKASYGCIRVSEEDLIYLFEICEEGTKVHIHL